MKRLLYILTALLTSVAASVFIMGTAHAIESYGFGAVPAYPNKDNPRAQSIFIYQLETGKTATDGVRVVNNSDESKTIAIYPVDSEASSDGAFACKQAIEARENVGAWIQLSKSEVTLEPHTEEIVSFTVTVPSGVDIGEYNGCIAVQDIHKNEATGNGIVLSFRSALRVAVMIPGDVKTGLMLKDFNVTVPKDKKNGTQKIVSSPLLYNSGNVSLDAQIDMSVRNVFGVEVNKSGGQFPILRGITSRFNIENEAPFWGGWYTVSGTVTYRQLQTTNQATAISKPITLAPQTIFVTPSPQALLIEIAAVLTVIGLIAFGAWRITQERLIRLRAYTYKIVDGDDIQTLAQQNKTTWKTIARMNHLKPPYHLQAGSEIKIPGSRRPRRSKQKKTAKE